MADIRPYQTLVQKQAGSTGATTTQTTTGLDTDNRRTITPGTKTQTHGTVTTTPGTKTITPGTKTQTHGAVTRTFGDQVTSEDARTTVQTQAAPTGVATTTKLQNAGFTISFSIPIRGGLNAGAAAPQNL